MKIDDTYYTCELEDVLDELISQLQINGIPYLQKGYKRSGDSLQVQCPYHGNGQEKHPSFGIRRGDGMGHCFACGAIVTLPEFITHCFDKDDVIGEFGRRWLRKNFTSVEVEERKDVDLDFDRSHSSKYSFTDFELSHDANADKRSNSYDGHNGSADNKYVEEDELDRYRYYHPYWENRGIIDDDILELFDLGFDKKTNCITFPVRNKKGDCLFIARRNVCTKFFNYPEGVVKPLYGLYELYQQASIPNDLIVCESMIDCILLWQAGYYAVALNGLGNAVQMRQLQQLPCRHIILATDNDEAGYKARERLRNALKLKLISYIDFPEGVKDIGEMSADQLRHLKEFEKF